MPSFLCISSREAPLVFGKNSKTITNCSAIMAAKKTNGCPSDAAGMAGYEIGHGHRCRQG
jgi:hypothetical protein